MIALLNRVMGIVGRLVLFCLLFWGGGGKTLANILSYEAVTLDLRGHDWSQEPIVSLDGNWYLQATFLPKHDVYGSPWIVQVPNTWPEYGRGFYFMRILLDSTHASPLAIYIPEFLTAYKVVLGKQVMGGNGHLGSTRESTIPSFGPRYFTVPEGATGFSFYIYGANFHHRQGGLVTAPLIGPLDQLMQRNQTKAIWGGILIGLLLMNSAYQFMRFGRDRQARAKLYSGLCTLVAGLHFLCLNDRWLYQFAGEGQWGLIYKVELLSLFCMLILALLFFQTFFFDVAPKWLIRLLLVLLGLQALYVIFMPVWIAALVDWSIPFVVMLLVASIGYLVLTAVRKKAEGAIPMAVATLLFLMASLADRFLVNVHVGGLLPIHYIIAFYVLTFSWILSRQSALIDRKLAEVSKALEQTNQQLAEQNLHLESEIERRTAELVAIQQKSHELELFHKQRDLEALHTNNQMKVQLTRNLIDELQALLRSGGDYQSALKGLISGLHGQIATQERLNVLQEDLATINAEFHHRLQTSYPQLSKTEREICAYLKLNLSGKDIAMLRKTSINTVNVARHRIRKKLGLERDEELEGFVQSV